MYQTTLTCSEDEQAIMAWFDVTPTFSSRPQELVASAFLEPPRVRLAEWPALNALAAATAITTPHQLAEHLTALSSTINQTIADEAEQIWLLMRAEPADVIGDMSSWMLAPAAPPTRAQAALTAVSDIQRWLAIGQDQVAELAGYAPRSVKNWRKGMDPYPTTVRRLFDLHALLRSLDRSIGTDGARLWLAATGQGGVSRRERLGNDAGLRGVIADAVTTLFEGPTVTPLHALDFEEETQWDVVPRPDAFAGAVQRVRRRS